MADSTNIAPVVNDQVPAAPQNGEEHGGVDSTSTTQTPDGGTMMTTKYKDGTVVDEVTQKDGSVMKVTTSPDGTVSMKMEGVGTIHMEGNSEGGTIKIDGAHDGGSMTIEGGPDGGTIHMEGGAGYKPNIDFSTAFVLSLVLSIIPLFKILKRAGLNPMHTFWCLVPIIGPIITFSIIAFSNWTFRR